MPSGGGTPRRARRAARPARPGSQPGRRRAGARLPALQHHQPGEMEAQQGTDRDPANSQARPARRQDDYPDPDRQDEEGGEEQQRAPAVACGLDLQRLPPTQRLGRPLERAQVRPEGDQPEGQPADRSDGERHQDVRKQVGIPERPARGDDHGGDDQEGEDAEERAELPPDPPGVLLRAHHIGPPVPEIEQRRVEQRLAAVVRPERGVRRLGEKAHDPLRAERRRRRRVRQAGARVPRGHNFVTRRGARWAEDVFWRFRVFF